MMVSWYRSNRRFQKHRSIRLNSKFVWRRMLIGSRSIRPWIDRSIGRSIAPRLVFQRGSESSLAWRHRRESKDQLAQWIGSPLDSHRRSSFLASSTKIPRALPARWIRCDATRDFNCRRRVVQSRMAMDKRRLLTRSSSSGTCVEERGERISLHFSARRIERRCTYQLIYFQSS